MRANFGGMEAPHSDTILPICRALRTGMTPATYIGSGGLYGRSDLAGLNLAQCPSILVECGNMKNDQDAALMTSEQGQQTIALAIGRGIQAFLQQS